MMVLLLAFLIRLLDRNLRVTTVYDDVTNRTAIVNDTFRESYCVMGIIPHSRGHSRRIKRTPWGIGFSVQRERPVQLARNTMHLGSNQAYSHHLRFPTNIFQGFIRDIIPVTREPASPVTSNSSGSDQKRRFFITAPSHALEREKTSTCSW